MNSRALFAAAGLCAIAAVSIEAADRYAFRHGVAALVAGVDGLSFERIVDQPWRGDARILGLALRRGDFSVHVGSLTFEASSALPPVAAALAGAGSAHAEDITVEAGQSIYRIKSVNLDGASLSDAALAHIFDRAAPQPLATRLGQLSATAITIPELTVETKFGAAKQSFIYREIALTSVVDGKAAAASAAGASFSLSNGERGDVEGAYGPMAAKNLDLVLGARIVAEAREEAAAPKLPLYDSLSIEGFHLGGPHFGLDVKNLTAAAAKGRPQAAEPGNGRPSSSDAKEQSFRVLDSFEIDDVAASGIRIDLNKDGEAAASLTIERARTPRLDGFRIEAVDGQNLALQRPFGRIVAESASFRGLDLAAIASAGHASERLADAKPGFEEIVLTRLSGENDEPVEDQSRAASSFKIDRLGVKSLPPQTGSATGLDVAMDHFTYPLSGAGPFGNLAALGYSTLDLSSRLSVVWTESTGELAIKDFTLDGAGMGSLRITGLVGNVTQNLASDDDEVAAAAARNILVKKLDIHLENAGLFDRSLAAQAKKQNKSVDEARQSDLMAASFVLPSLLGNEPSARLIGSELAKFIAEPKNFSLVAQSREGFGLADLELVKTPRALLKKIEVSASANE